MPRELPLSVDSKIPSHIADLFDESRKASRLGNTVYGRLMRRKSTKLFSLRCSLGKGQFPEVPLDKVLDKLLLL